MFPSNIFSHQMLYFLSCSIVFFFKSSTYYFLDKCIWLRKVSISLHPISTTFYSKSVCISCTIPLPLYTARKKKSDIKKRKTKYLSSHERKRIRLLWLSRDSTLVIPSSFESTYISSPTGFTVQCAPQKSLLSIRSTFPLLSNLFLSTTHRTRVSGPDRGKRRRLHKL